MRELTVIWNKGDIDVFYVDANANLEMWDNLFSIAFRDKEGKQKTYLNTSLVREMYIEENQ